MQTNKFFCGSYQGLNVYLLKQNFHYLFHAFLSHVYSHLFILFIQTTTSRLNLQAQLQNFPFPNFFCKLGFNLHTELYHFCMFLLSFSSFLTIITFYVCKCRVFDKFSFIVNYFFPRVVARNKKINNIIVLLVFL